MWGLPGQVAFASLYATGASLMLVFVAVALTNANDADGYLGADILHLRARNPVWRGCDDAFRTSWAQIGFMQTSMVNWAYYTGFSLMICIWHAGTLLDFP